MMPCSISKSAFSYSSAQPNTELPVVHVVDDEKSVREALHFMLTAHGYEVRTYQSGEVFLRIFDESSLSGCIVLDVRMEPISGLQVHEVLLARGSFMPIIFLSGHGDIPMAIKAVRDGAFDFIEKPFDDAQLLSRVKDALAYEASAKNVKQQQQSAKDLWAQLSKREVAVITRVAKGKLNKVIADELSVALRTVEVHRSSALIKLGIRSAAQAATLIAALNINYP
jgi:two-component system, LuxR family, response regulator DctR